MKNLLSYKHIFVLHHIHWCLLYTFALNNEGEICTTNGDSCKKLKDCSYFNQEDIKKRKFQPPICGYNGPEPIVCCTKNFNNMFGFSRKTKSAETCEKYEHIICSKKSKNSRNVSNQVHNVPFMALIGYGNTNNTAWRCVGSIISTRYVLSSAQCSNNRELGPAKRVKVGDFEDNTKSQYFFIVFRFTNSEYHSPSQYHDIALFRLSREVHFNDYVRPICLHQFISILTHNTVIAVGRGRFETSEPLDLNPTEIELNLLPLNNCNISYYRDKMSEGPHRRGTICAGDLEYYTENCPEDIGGPVYLPPTKGELDEGCFLYTQVGITSSIYQCGNNIPGVYTNVGNYIHWIESIVWPNDNSTSDSAVTVWA